MIKTNKVMGKWIEDGIPYKCSCCGEKLYCCAMPGDKGINLPDICPSCGARMQGLVRQYRNKKDVK